MRSVNFRDFTFFQNFGDDGKPAGSVSLSNAHYRHDEPDHLSMDLESVYYLDRSRSLNEEFALLLFSWFAVGGTSSQGGIAQVFTLSNGHLRVIQEMGWDTHFEPGAQPTDSFDARTSTLLVRTAHEIPGDALCCISAMDVVRLKWDGTRFVQTSLETELSEYGKREGKRLPR